MIKVENINMKFKLDTGSEVNIIPMRVYEYINEEIHRDYRPTAMVLEAYGGFKIRPKGQIELRANYRNLTINLNFIIAGGDIKPILGLRACVTLGIIARMEKN